VLDQGQIVASGPHDALLESSALYARLWDVQTGQGHEHPQPE
jgi:ABC-type multidrug transport system fused ATPase/permease subunit